MSVTARALDEATWPDFARLVEAHHGVFGGCWCMAFHPARGGTRDAARNRTDKQARVQAGTAHAALVYDGGDCVGWCQFGSSEELPRIEHRKAYGAGAAAAPDWRITCFFVARGQRRSGVAAAALDGALAEIARLGGGTVESYPEDVEGRTVSVSFLYNATVALFESVPRRGGRSCPGLPATQSGPSVIRSRRSGLADAHARLPARRRVVEDHPRLGWCVVEQPQADAVRDQDQRDRERGRPPPPAPLPAQPASPDVVVGVRPDRDLGRQLLQDVAQDVLGPAGHDGLRRARVNAAMAREVCVLTAPAEMPMAAATSASRRSSQ